MSQENVKPEQIQASVAAALSRLRGDVAPPSDAPNSAPPPTPTPAPAPTGMAPGMSGMGVRPDPMRPPANDLRAEPGLRPIPSSSMQSGMGAPMASEPPTAKEPELPRAMFSRPGPSASAPTNPMGGASATPAQPATQPEPAPTVQRPASPLSRMMSREAPGAEAAKPIMEKAIEKTLSPTQQPDLLAGLPPPPLSDALTQEDDGGARRRRNRRILMLGTAIVVVAGAFWLFTRGGGDSADAPVISADMAPEKVKPADEGGLQVPNQNVQVLDNTEQTAEGETVLPPPEQPVTPPEPTAEAPQPAEPPAVVDSNGATVVEDVPAVTAPEPAPAPTAEAPAVPAPESTAEATQPTEAAPAVPESTPEPATPAQETASAPEPAPAPEPAAPATTQEAAVTPPPAPAAVGNTRVQLAAVKSEDNARTEWAKMQKAHPDLLGGLTLNIERVDKGASGIFYRIQAGPVADRAAAKQLCASLKGQGQDCIVAK
jgi:hypothetical protein